MEHIREGKNLAMEIDYQFRLIVTYEHDLSLNATTAATPIAKTIITKFLIGHSNVVYCFHLRIFVRNVPASFLSSI